MKLAIAALVLALALNMSEAWAWATPLDLWAADAVAQGLLQCLAAVLIATQDRAMWPACAVMLVFGLGRATCTAIWPEASDAGGAICDKQTGLPGTLAIAGFAAWAAGRTK